MAQVTTRLHIAVVSRRSALFTLILAGLLALLLVLAKGISLLPDVFAWWMVLFVPAVAVLAALALTPRPLPREAAHVIDERLHAKDLFLTAALLDTAPGDYKPLVQDEAQRVAADVRPATIVPFAFTHRGGQALAAVALLTLATLLPTFDPFGLHEQREIEQQRRDQLLQTMQATEMRKAALQRQDIAAERSAEVDHAVEQLKQSLQQMRREDQRGNLERLRDQQANLNDVYQRSLERREAEQGNRRGAIQQLGAAPNQAMRQMMQQAAKGDAGALKQKIDELKEKLEQAAESRDVAEQRQLAEQVRQELQQMQSAAEQSGADGVCNAVQNALQQMQMAGMEGMTGEAMAAAMDSLNLAQMELDQLAQMAMDAEAMREAMEALQMAMQACQMGTLDGEPCQGLGGMSEYLEQLVLMCQGGGDGDRDGGGSDSPGGRRAGQFGSGGIGEEEDHSQNVASSDVRAPGRFVPGSTIMSWKTRDAAQDGEARREYTQAVSEVRQAVSAAVVPDDVPPGYREVIQSYLANVERDLGPAAPIE